MEPATQPSVRTKHLAIVDDNGKEVAVLTATAGGAGFWIKGPDGSQVAIFNIQGQTAIGFYDKASQGDTKGMSFALTMNGNEPQIQIRDKDGDAFFVTAADLKAIAQRVKE